MSLLDWIFGKRADAAIAATVRSVMDDVLPDVMAEVMTKRALARVPIAKDERLTELGFVWEMAFEFIRHGVPCWQAKDLAFATFNAFLKDEGIKFRDPAYDWSQAGAATLAQECEIQYWERAA